MMIEEIKDDSGSVSLPFGKQTVVGSTVIMGDCVEVMKGFLDNHFDLAIVDPPYGIDAGNKINFRESRAYQKVITKYKKKDWDKNIPDETYFSELFRVSKHQIIWGGNHFVKYLPASRGWCYWDKGYTSDRLSYSDAELAFTSFDVPVKKFILKMSDWRNCVSGNVRVAFHNPNKKIHPTQKPVRLYEKLLNFYAKPGMKILDTHLGSQSSRIAADKLKFDFTGIEIDVDYFNEGCQRYSKYKSQLRIEGW